MLIGFKRGQGSIIIRVKILNSSVSTGAGLTGLTSASSGLIISTIADTESTATAYTVAASNVETITTLGTFSAPTSGKCRFKELDATNHKGVYEMQIADARFNVSSAKSLLVSVSGATNAAETDVVIPLRDLDPFDAVRAGLTALPNVASGSAGAIITSGTGTAQLSVSSGNVTLAAVTHTGATIPTVSTVTNGVTVTTNNDKTGYSLTQTFPTNFSSLAITASGSVTAGTVSDKTGYSLSSSQTFSTSGSVGSVTGAVGSVTGNVGGNVVGSVASVTAAVTVGTNNDKTGYSLTQAFPSNFAALGINSSGHISRVTLVDTTTTNTDMRGTDSAALASAWTATRAGYLDSVLLSGSANRTVKVTGTGAGHVAADLHESQPGSIHATTFDAGAIDAAALAADATTEIANGLLDLANGIETGLTLRQAIRLDTAALVGKLSGADGTTVTIRNVGDTTDRIVATVDANGNRSAVTTDAT